MMNKIHLIYISTIVALTITIGYLFYTNLDKSITIGYMETGYERTENDLKTLTRILNDQIIDKQVISKIVRKSSDFYLVNEEGAEMHRVEIHFKEDGKISAVFN